MSPGGRRSKLDIFLRKESKCKGKIGYLASEELKYRDVPSKELDMDIYH
jgi:hypothetical protein